METFGCSVATRSSGCRRPSSISITMHARGTLGEALGQHPLPSPDLEHDVLGIERRIGDDRLQQVGVGEEVLA